MTDTQDWKEAARVELAARLEDALTDSERHHAEEKAARARRQAADELAGEIISAAAVLGISLTMGPHQFNDAPASGAKEPTAREIILGALKASYPKPLKAAELRTIIEEKIGRSVHYKTPGMTLYRLADDKLVRREGHSWFAVEGGQLSLGQQQMEELLNT